MAPRTLVGKRLLGYAATVRVAANNPGDDESKNRLMDYYAHLRETAKPSIAVVQDIDPQPIGSFWGEVQATVHKSLGAIGTLTLGGVRDLAEVEDLAFQFFSTHMLISHANTHVVECGCGVDILGLRVNPGDLIFADVHGVVQIPHEIADRLPKACKGIADAELPILEPCRDAIKNNVLPAIDDIRVWREKMQNARLAVSKDL
jgi:Demethylmenaquinone methyltransferase